MNNLGYSRIGPDDPIEIEKTVTLYMDDIADAMYDRGWINATEDPEAFNNALENASIFRGLEKWHNEQMSHRFSLANCDQEPCRSIVYESNRLV